MEVLLGSLRGIPVKSIAAGCGRPSDVEGASRTVGEPYWQRKVREGQGGRAGERERVSASRVSYTGEEIAGRPMQKQNRPKGTSTVGHMEHLFSLAIIAVSVGRPTVEQGVISASILVP